MGNEQTNNPVTLPDPARVEMIRERLEMVYKRIAVAAERAGRRLEDIHLIAVSKTFGAGDILAAWETGQHAFGESRVQEALPKIERLGVEPIHWHLIGHLQRNKVRQVIGRFELIHSVDSVRLIEELEQRAAKEDVTQRILFQVNVAGEESKYGAAPERMDELLEALGGCRQLVCEGLMTIPPIVDEAERVRPYFERLRDLLGSLPTSVNFKPVHLSMGMSHDFEAAIVEGATLVRVGSAIFGERG